MGKNYCNECNCEECPQFEKCGGCEKTDGHPFGGECIAAEKIKSCGMNCFADLKQRLIDEINALGIPDLHVDNLNLLNGAFVNLEYPLANGTSVRFLKDDYVYLGNQIERPDGDRCYGVIADETMLLVCEYGCMGADPTLLVYRKR